MAAKTLVGILFFSASLSACQQRKYNTTAVKQFNPTEILETQESPGRLPWAKVEAGLKEDQVVALRHKTVVGGLFQTEIQFKNLTLPQAQKLRSLYATAGAPWTPLEEVRNTGSLVSIFTLMPPLVQATAGLVFEQQEENTSQLRLELKEKGINNYPSLQKTSANCWGTAWEFQRLLRAPRPAALKDGDTLGSTAVFYTSVGILEALRKPEHSTLIKTLPSPGKVPFSANSPDKGLGLKPGDGLLMVAEFPDGGELLIHAASVVDEGLYFEKVGVESHAVYRMAYLEDVLQQYGEMGGVKMKLEWRRFTGTPLPHPSAIFATQREAESAGIPPQVSSTKKNETFSYRIYDVDMKYDATKGLVQLDPKAFEKGTFMHDTSCGRGCMKCQPRVPTDDGLAEFEIPLISDAKETVVLLPKRIASDDRALGRYPPEGILLRKSAKGFWKGSWNNTEFNLEFSSNRVYSTLDIEGVGKGDRDSCRFISQ